MWFQFFSKLDPYGHANPFSTSLNTVDPRNSNIQYLAISQASIIDIPQPSAIPQVSLSFFFRHWQPQFFFSPSVCFFFGVWNETKMSSLVLHYGHIMRCQLSLFLNLIHRSNWCVVAVKAAVVFIWVACFTMDIYKLCCFLFK